MPRNKAGQVFINCPFDAEYTPLLRAIQFTVIACGFVPRCALDEDNSADVRIHKILRLIEECRYGIHDICRTELDARSGLPRFNMPFELGLFLGARAYSSGASKHKSALILDKEQYRYQKFLSDIAGQDIKSHEGSAAGAIQVVRKWLNAQERRQDHPSLPGTDDIQKNFNDFMSAVPKLLKKNQSEKDQSFVDWSNLMSQWVILM